MSRYGLIVIGSGPAGVGAAASYLQAGGAGPVLMVTSDTREPYARPPLSKDVLVGKAPVEPSPLPVPDGVELRLHSTVTGVDIDQRTVRVGDDSLGFDRLVVATGSTPATLPGVEPGADVHVLRSFDDAHSLVEAAGHARTAVVVGSGFIGCEAAASLAIRGVETTLVTPEAGPQQDRLGEHAASAITEWLTGLGVTLRTGVQVSGIEAPRTVHLDDGTTLAPDLILTALGVNQNGDVLAGTGAQLFEGRVVVDEHLQALPGVWVAGDVARATNPTAGRALSVEHWGDADGMGQIAGHNAALPDDGQPQPWDATPGFWSTIGEHTLKYSAWGDGYETAEVVRSPGAFTVWYADGNGALVGVLTYNADDDYERGQRLIAGHAPLDDALSGKDVEPQDETE